MFRDTAEGWFKSHIERIVKDLLRQNYLKDTKMQRAKQLVNSVHSTKYDLENS